jgi:hypothetical protein
MTSGTSFRNRHRMHFPFVVGTESNFDFCSLIARAHEASQANLGNSLHTIARSAPTLKHFRQPYDREPHLHKRETGSPFLVDRKGKPKDNTSVSVYAAKMARRVMRVYCMVPLLSPCFYNLRWSVGHLLFQIVIPRKLVGPSSCSIRRPRSTEVHRIWCECSQIGLRD